MMASTTQAPVLRNEEVRCARIRSCTAVRVVALVCLLVFTWTAWITQSFPPAFSAVDVGPARVPLTASILGIIFSAFLLYKAGSKGDLIEVQRPHCVGCGALVILAYVLAMPNLGFYITSFAATPLLLLVGGERRLHVLFAFTAGFVLFIYICFDLLLAVQFP